MKKRMMKRVAALGLAVTIATSATGCGLIKPYDKPELVTIEASEVAFLIPLVGDTEDQVSFQSEALLAKAMIATKEITIQHRWIKTGRLPGDGKWIPTHKLITVDRKPVNREWNSMKDSGTSKKNQAIYAESKESIGFSVGMNCSCQIDNEEDAIKFLYSYNTDPLSKIMDKQIRSKVESAFVETCARYSMDEILEKKDEIMKSIRDEIVPYFKERGITITNLGMKDGIKYDDPEIQKTINEKFSSAQRVITQSNENDVKISKAEAEAQAKIIKAEAEAEANRIIAESLTDSFIEYNKTNKYTEKWDGSVPKVSTGSDANMIMDIGNVVNEKGDDK